MPPGQAPVRARRTVMSRSILLAGPHFARQAGGLERALADLVGRICTRWASRSTMRPGVHRAGGASASGAPAAHGSTLNRSAAAARAVGAPVAATAAGAARSRSRARRDRARGRACWTSSSAGFAARRYDAVLYCVEEAPPGGLALAQARHRCVIPIAIEGLAAELAGGAMSGRSCVRAAAHPWLGGAPTRARSAARSCRADRGPRRPCAPGSPRGVVHSGLFRRSGAAARAPAARAFGGRLLYVGRLVKEKGVHVLLEGVARARARDPRLSLTLVRAKGRRPIVSLVRAAHRRARARGGRRLARAGAARGAAGTVRGARCAAVLVAGGRAGAAGGDGGDGGAAAGGRAGAADAVADLRGRRDVRHLRAPRSRGDRGGDRAPRPAIRRWPRPSPRAAPRASAMASRPSTRRAATPRCSKRRSPRVG